MVGPVNIDNQFGGLEYRTLSNFWLQSYQLMSLMLGMVRFSVH